MGESLSGSPTIFYLKTGIYENGHMRKQVSMPLLADDSGLNEQKSISIIETDTSLVKQIDREQGADGDETTE